MELTTFNNNPVIESLFERAAKDLPAYLSDQKDELPAAAWIAQRMLGLAERDRKNHQTVQALLTDWLSNGELGKLWMEHPNDYPNLREFLRDVGTEEEGNKLGEPVISDLVAISDIIVPYCRAHDMEASSFFTANLWTRFRAVIPTLRKAAEADQINVIREVLDDVKALPTGTLRLKYHGQRKDKIAVGDSVQKNGTTVIVLVAPTAETTALRQQLGRYVDWQTIAVGDIGSDGAARLTVLTK